MEPEILAARLEETAEGLGVEVRSCPAESEGGLVMLKERRVLFIPEGTPAARRAEVIASALAPLDIEGVFLVPAVREAVERERDRDFTTEARRHGEQRDEGDVTSS